MPETLRQRAERIYRFEVTSHPTAALLAQPELIEEMPDVTLEEQVDIALFMGMALRNALFDLAEQLDTLLGTHAEPEPE
jgi:hypothetical protein